MDAAEKAWLREGGRMSPEQYRAVALAAAFVKHGHEGNKEGQGVILDEVNQSDEMLSDFVEALTQMALSFGRELFGDQFGETIQDMAIQTFRNAEEAGDEG